VKVGACAVPVQCVETSRRRDDIHQALAVSLLEQGGDFLEAFPDFPAGLFPPDNLLAVENDAIGFDLVPRQN
jgi:hypothetical protein